MVLQPLPLASRLSELRPVAGVLLLLVMSGLLLLVILLLLVKLLLLLLLPRRASGLLPPSPLGGIMSGCGLRLTSPLSCLHGLRPSGLILRAAALSRLLELAPPRPAALATASVARVHTDHHKSAWRLGNAAG